MDDVRTLVRGGLALWLAAVTAAVASMIVLHRRGRSAVARLAVRRGAILTVAVLAVSGLAMLVAYEAVFDGFHALFFPDGTWSFADHYTLRRIYPDAFWTIASAAMVLISLLQVALLLGSAGRTERAAISSGPATP